MQDLRWNTLDSLGDGEVEDGEVFKLCLSEFAIVDGVDDGSSVLEGTSFPGTEFTTGPTSVDEPTVDLVGGHSLSKHLGVSTWVEDNEGLTVTCGEGGGWLDDTVLGTRSLGGVSSDKVVGSLLGCQPGNRWEDTESVATKHDDVGRLSVGDTRDLGVGDVFDGVGTSSVLGNADIVVVGYSVCGVVNDILEDGSELDGTEDLRLLLG